MSVDISWREAAIVGAVLLNANGDALPPTLARLIANAPESFDDARYGKIALAIRQQRNAGKHPTPLSVIDDLNFEGAVLTVSNLREYDIDLAEADAGPVWTAFQQRKIKSLLGEGLNEMEAKPAQAESIAANVRKSLEALAQEQSGSLPPIDNAAELLGDDLIQLPPQIISGVLHQGLKAVLGGNSKGRKTWILLDVATSVATGMPWWKWDTQKGRVLYINFEIPRAFIRSRIKCLCSAKGITDISNLDVWTLRGRAAALGGLLSELIQRILNGRYSLAIIDPIYKGLGGRDENSAGDISELCNELERIAVETGAAVFYTAHYAKGNAAGKEAIDRISGSGVWTRDADGIITLTRHKVEGAYTVELILRNLPEVEPFVVEWKYPRMVHNPNLHPDDLKQPGGRKREHEADELWKLLGKRSLTSTEWQEKADSELGAGRRTFYTLRKELEEAGRILKSATNDKWTQIKQ